MDHAEAINMRAAERYVLSDLSVSEVEGFERHFFDCPQCSEELRILSVLQENARAVFIEQNSTPSFVPAVVPAISTASPASLPATKQKAARAGWRFSWQFAFAPALVVLIAAVFLGFEMGERKVDAPQSVNAYPLYAASRGSETVVAVPAGSQFFTLYMDRTWDGEFASYRAAIRDDGQTGAERASMPIASAAQGHMIQVLMSARSLPAGRYVLTILGKDGSGKETKAADYSFTLRFE
ncbi:MAG TPA: hypothetical protein VNT29_05680 [Candidatus Limnocylindrales bacterium]|nr:hypothetical protein [Candidatus Limnocylindrales bacterium]